MAGSSDNKSRLIDSMAKQVLLTRPSSKKSPLSRRLLKLKRNPRAFFVDSFWQRTGLFGKSASVPTLAMRLLESLDAFDWLKRVNVLVLKQHMRRRDVVLSSYPKLLHVEMTTYCNIRCRMCSIVRPARTRKIQHLDMDVMERLRPVLPYVTDVKMHGGGEPFLNPNIEKIMEIFQQYGVKLNTVTNATVINDRLARLIGRNFSTLTISLDGATAPVFEEVREGARFERVMKSIDLLNKYKSPDFKMIFGIVILRCNAHELPALVRLAKEKGAAEVQAAWVVPFPDLPWSNEQDPTREPERMNRMLRETYVVAKELSIRLKLPPFLPETGTGGTALKEHRPTYHQLHPTNEVEGACQLMYDRAMVLVDGTIKPCGQSRSVSDLGTLKKNTFQEIWSGSGYQRLRNTFNGGTMPVTCRSCNFIRTGQLGKARLVIRSKQGLRLPLMPLEISR